MGIGCISGQVGHLQTHESYLSFGLPTRQEKLHFGPRNLFQHAISQIPQLKISNMPGCHISE